jgi:hypothetical protein
VPSVELPKSIVICSKIYESSNIARRNVMQVTYRPNCSVGNVLSQLNGREKPDLWIFKCFKNLIRLQVMTFYASQIILDSFNRLILIFFPEEPGADRAIWNEIPTEDGPNQGQTTKD